MFAAVFVPNHLDRQMIPVVSRCPKPLRQRPERLMIRVAGDACVGCALLWGLKRLGHQRFEFPHLRRLKVSMARDRGAEFFTCGGHGRVSCRHTGRDQISDFKFQISDFGFRILATVGKLYKRKNLLYE